MESGEGTIPPQEDEGSDKEFNLKAMASHGE
jgi:hypothetical protein